MYSCDILPKMMLFSPKLPVIFLESLTTHNQGFINNTVVVELIWVLIRSYKKTREQIIVILDELFAMHVFEFENRELLLDVLQIYQATKADFSDLLICKINQSSHCQKTMTLTKLLLMKQV